MALEQTSNMNIETTTELVDISTVKVNQALSKFDKTKEFVRQLNGNPLRYKCGKFIVIAIHPENGPSLEDCLQGMLV